MSSLSEWRLHVDKPNPLFTEYVSLCQDAGWAEIFDGEEIEVGPTDALIVVDMQNDFIPIDELNQKSGRFSCAEGGDIVPLVIRLMELFAKKGGHIVATRDYHPKCHCSFLPKGPFPPHCIQGSVGSYFYQTIGDSLAKLRADGPNVQIVFKGYHEDIDSFAAFEYEDCEETFQRISSCDDHPERLYGCSHVAWTGSVQLDCSNLDDDINAPPDILACRRAVTLAEYLKNSGVTRIFAVGLALDFCVLDTCLSATQAGFAEVSMILDAARPAYVPALAVKGSGFIQDPADVFQQMRNRVVKVRPAVAFIPELVNEKPVVTSSCFPTTSSSKECFPDSLGPFALVKARDMVLHFAPKTCLWEIPGPAEVVSCLDLCGVNNRGRTSPVMALTLDEVSKTNAGIPADACHFAFCYPAARRSNDKKSWAAAYSATTTPTFAFAINGGFVYLKENRSPCAKMALCPGGGLEMGPPQKLLPEYVHKLRNNNWENVSLKPLKDKDAQLFTWIPPGETIDVKGIGRVRIGGPHGAFAYLFHTNIRDQDPRDVFFQIESSTPGVAQHGRVSIAELPPNAAFSTASIVSKKSPRASDPLSSIGGMMPAGFESVRAAPARHHPLTQKKSRAKGKAKKK